MKNAGLLTPGQIFNPGIFIFKGLLRAIVLSLFIIMLISLVLTYSNLSDVIAPFAAFALSLIGILAGSIYVGRVIGTKGWLNGGLMGLIYVTFLAILNFIFVSGYGVGFIIIPKFFIGFVFGAIGGIVGINN